VRTSAAFFLTGAGLLSLACQDKTLNVLQEPPAVTVQEPSDGTSFYTGQTILFKAKVQTYDGTDLTDLTHQWVSGNETICLSDLVPADGYATCSWAYETVGDHTVTVTVTDPRLSSATASVGVTIVENTPPTIEITRPDDGAVDVAGAGIVFQALVDDTEETSENLLVTVNSSIDGDIASGYATSAGQYSGQGYLSAGDHLIIMTVEDSYGRTAQDTLTMEILDPGPPRIDAVTIDPNPADTEDTLTPVVTGWIDPADPSNTDETYSYRWYVSDDSGTLNMVSSSATLDPGYTRKGRTVQVEVTPYNADYGNGTPKSADLVIINSVPTTPTVRIDPEFPEPGDNLYCTASSTDADNDGITYTYEWTRDGTLTSQTTNVVSYTATSHGETWECEATPYDGEDYGNPGTDYVTVDDTEAPTAPVFDTPTAYRNEEEVTLTGTCEAGCDLTFYCSDDDGSWSDTDTCDSGGEFSYTTALTAGNVTQCYATCEDDAGNLSGNSGTVKTEVCDPGDENEDSLGTGDAGADAIDLWSSLADDASTTITIEANILSDDTTDWYKISGADDVSEDRSDGLDYYRFQVQMVSGTSTYQMYVYRDSYDSSAKECSSGVTEYEHYQEDQGDGSHTIPSDARSCGNGSGSYNDCEDNSTDYYIQIVRTSSTVTSCQGYELEVTNGVW
jgi:hypothetical protein